jgi:hypothetical protein
MEGGGVSFPGGGTGDGETPADHFAQIKEENGENGSTKSVDGVV